MFSVSHQRGLASSGLSSVSQGLIQTQALQAKESVSGKEGLTLTLLFWEFGKGIDDVLRNTREFARNADLSINQTLLGKPGTFQAS